MLTWTPKPSRSWPTVDHAHGSYTSSPLAYTDVYIFRKLLETVLQSRGPRLVYILHWWVLLSTLLQVDPRCAPTNTAPLTLWYPCLQPFALQLWWRLGRGAESQLWHPEVRFVVTLSLGIINAIIRK